MAKNYLSKLGSCNPHPVLLQRKKDSLSSSSTVVSSEAFNPGEIDTLGNWYHRLGCFSGSILVSEEGEIVYQKYFGKADHEADENFSVETIFLPVLYLNF